METPPVFAQCHLLEGPLLASSLLHYNLSSPLLQIRGRKFIERFAFVGNQELKPLSLSVSKGKSKAKPASSSTPPLSRLRSDRAVVSLLHLEFRPTVHGPTFRIVSPVLGVRRDRILLAAPLGTQAPSRNPSRDQILHHRLGAPLR